MRTHPVDREAAVELLSPFSTLLVSATRTAFDDWAFILAKAPTHTGGLTPRTMLSFIHERIVHQLRMAEINGQCPGLRVRRIRGLNVAIVGDRLMVKLKKLDKKYRSRNISTRQTRKFDAQEPLIQGDDLDLTNATSGYVLDEAGAEPLHIVVTCWSGSTNHWTLDLDTDMGQLVELEATPVEHAEAEGEAVQEDEAQGSDK
jgi:hypothetical protein